MEADLGTLLPVLLLVAVLLLGKNRLRRLGAGDLGTRLRHELDADDLAERLRGELLGRMPVYSAETTTGKEAEFIRDRLPRRFSWPVMVAGVVLVGALAWWLTR
jgi:hypothetical protein